MAPLDGSDRGAPARKALPARAKSRATDRGHVARRRAFLAALDTVCSGGGHTRDRAFRDWAAMSACSLVQEGHWRHARGADPEVEARYLGRARAYARPQLDAMGDMLGIVALALQEEDGDFLGTVFMDDPFWKASGQVFTPWHTGLAVAKMTIGDAAAIDSASAARGGGPITISDPACGAGCLLLAAASAMAEVGRDPRRHGLFWATDIDPLCADMVLIQLSLRGLPALVAEGDSLRLRCVRVMPTLAWSLVAPPPEQFFTAGIAPANA